MKIQSRDNDLAMLRDMSNPISRSINHMKFVKKFTRIKGLKEMMDLNYFEGPSSLYAYYQSGRRVFSNLGIPKELFYLLGIDMVFVEQLSTLVAMTSKDTNRELIARSRSIIPSSTYCTFHQAALGAIESGYFPLPDAFIAPSFICEETISLFAYLGKKYQRPVFYLDCPKDTDEAAEEYLAAQLEELAYKLADMFKIEITKKSIQQTFAYANEARKWWLQYQDLRFQLNINATDITLQTILLSNTLYSKYGLEETIRVTRESYQDLHATTTQDTDDPQDAIRILWIHLIPYQTSSSSALINLLKDPRINIVTDVISQITWPPLDAAQPWRSLARKFMTSYGYGSIDTSFALIDDIVERGRIEAVIELCHPGCKPGSGKSFLLNRHLASKNIPHLSFEADLIDHENFSSEQIRLRLEAFIEMLKESRFA